MNSPRSIGSSFAAAKAATEQKASPAPTVSIMDSQKVRSRIQAPGLYGEGVGGAAGQPAVTGA